jgi:phenylacetate-CoA ligase
MNPVAFLWKRSRLERDMRRTRAQLEARQLRAIAQVRAFALDRSPFYQRFYRGFEQRPWTELPILSKAELMDHFDDLVTDRAVRLTDVEAHLHRGDPNALFRGRYVVLATSGSTGQRGIFLFNPGEWLDVIVAFTRPGLWAGVQPKLFRPQRMATLASTAPWHYSARTGQATSSPLFPALRLDAAEAVDSTVRQLNQWQPEFLAGYPSVLKSLAEEQIASRLRISPRLVFSVAEVLAAETRRRMREAWPVPVFDIYGSTEYCPIAVECPLGRKHLLEDGAAIEIVDYRGRPVADGTLGDRVLLTVFNRWTQPLIRYEISDMVRPAALQCECGRPFRVIDRIEGRQQDVLHFGSTAVHPNVFHRVLETVPAAGWQVIQERDELRVCLLGLREGYPVESLQDSIHRLLRESGAEPPPIRVEKVESLRRGATGKAGLIVASAASS